MPELSDGESVEIWGSGSSPYLLKNVGGVFSCTCPACAISPSPSTGVLANTFGTIGARKRRRLAWELG